LLQSRSGLQEVLSKQNSPGWHLISAGPQPPSVIAPPLVLASPPELEPPVVEPLEVCPAELEAREVVDPPDAEAEVEAAAAEALAELAPAAELLAALEPVVSPCTDAPRHPPHARNALTSKIRMAPPAVGGPAWIARRRGVVTARLTPTLGL
jgi:hypothetical protein